MNSFLTVLLAVAAIGFVLWSRMKGQPLKAKRLLVLPVLLTVIGITGLKSHLSWADIAFLVVSLVVSVSLGVARGATIELYPNQGELWQRYRRSTVALWVALMATKVALLGVASAAGASAGGGTNSILVSLGASLLAEAAVVGPRALSTGLPFAGDDRRPSPAPKWDNAATMTEQSGAVPSRAPSWRDGLDWLLRQIDERGQADR